MCPHGLTADPCAVGREGLAETSSPEPAFGTVRRDDPSHAPSLAPKRVSHRIFGSCKVPPPQPGSSRSVRRLGLDATMQKHRCRTEPAQEHSASPLTPAPGSPRPSPSARATAAHPHLRERGQLCCRGSAGRGMLPARTPTAPIPDSLQGHVTGHQLPTFKSKTPPRSSQMQEDTKLICYSELSQDVNCLISALKESPSRWVTHQRVVMCSAHLKHLLSSFLYPGLACLFPPPPLSFF